MSEKKNPYAPILILGWTGLVLMTALVLTASWWAYFVSTDDGVIDYLFVVILMTVIWSVVAFVSYATLDNRKYNEDMVARFLTHDSALVIEKLPGERFRASRAGLPDVVAYADSPQMAITKFAHGQIRKVEDD